MRKHLRLFFQSAVILVILQMTGESQPAFVSGGPNDHILPTSGFTRPLNSFTEFIDLVIVTTTASNFGGLMESSAHFHLRRVSPFR